MPIKKQSKVDSLFTKEVTFESADQQIYGATGQGQREGKAIENIPIFDITPDPMQPRRAIPSALREGWNGDPQELNAIFERWIDLIKAERNADFPVQELFKQASKQTTEQADESGAGDDLHSEQPGPLETTFMTILNLAGSIKRDTLVNPITVARGKDGYQLETGERRWLAHHLLYILTDNTRYLEIKAVIVTGVNVWRQAAENNARADLNAIGKARQFAILLMDLLRHEGHTFQPMSAFDNERDFYAQVADGEQFRIPRGKGEMLLNAIGLKNGRQLRDYRRLLSLPDEVWRLADDYNWAEGRLRQLYEQALNDEELIYLVQMQLEMGDTVPIGTVSDEDTTPKDAVARKSSVKKDDWIYSSEQKQRISELLKLMNQISRGSNDKKIVDAAYQLLADQRVWLQNVEAALAQLINEQNERKR